MTICRAVDCVYNSREEEESGGCTFDEDKREVGARRDCTSYIMDMKYVKKLGRQSRAQEAWRLDKEP